jgi:hypothetical protein
MFVYRRCFRSLSSPLVVLVFDPLIVLSRVFMVRWPSNPHEQGVAFSTIDNMIHFVDRQTLSEEL